MFLRRMSPAFPFGDFRREMDRLFTDFGIAGPGSASHGGESFPAVNIWEDQESIYVEAECPGLKMTDLDLSVVGNELAIRGERKPRENGDTAYHRRERACGPFTRFVTLPVAVETQDVEAVLRDGVLTITLPKAAEAKPRRIEVKAT